MLYHYSVTLHKLIDLSTEHQWLITSGKKENHILCKYTMQSMMYSCPPKSKSNMTTLVVWITKLPKI